MAFSILLIATSKPKISNNVFGSGDLSLPDKLYRNGQRIPPFPISVAKENILFQIFSILLFS